MPSVPESCVIRDGSRRYVPSTLGEAKPLLFSGSAARKRLTSAHEVDVDGARKQIVGTQ
jgi:hypothetical protein